MSKQKLIGRIRGIPLRLKKDHAGEKLSLGDTKLATGFEIHGIIFNDMWIIFAWHPHHTNINLLIIERVDNLKLFNPGNHIDFKCRKIDTEYTIDIDNGTFSWKVQKKTKSISLEEFYEICT